MEGRGAEQTYGTREATLEEVTHPLSSSGPVMVEVHHSGDLDSFPSSEAMQEPLDTSRCHLSNRKGVCLESLRCSAG